MSGNRGAVTREKRAGGYIMKIQHSFEERIKALATDKLSYTYVRTCFEHQSREQDQNE